MAGRLSLAVLLGCASADASAFPANLNETLVKQGLKLITTEAIEVSRSPMRVEGKIPEWLNGRYYRNGPGAFEVDAGQGMNGSQHVNSLFDGYAVTNMFQLDGRSNKAYRSTKFLGSPRYENLRKRHDMSYQGKLMAGTTPERKEFLNPFNMGGEFSVNFFSVGAPNTTDGQHFLATGEMAWVMEIDPLTLETVKGTDKGGPGMNDDFFKFNDNANELGMGCAHPIKFPNGDMYNKIAAVDPLSAGLETTYNIVRIPAGTTKRELVGSYPTFSPGIIYGHSFAMPSTKYAAIPMWPLFNEKWALASKNILPGFKWQPSKGTDFVVLDLEENTRTLFHVNETFFGFHFVNSWVEKTEKGDELVMDVTTMHDASVFATLQWAKMQDGSMLGGLHECAEIKRVRIPLYSETVEERGHLLAKEMATLEPLHQTKIEVPRINDAYFNNGDYQFIYGWHATLDGNLPNSVAKLDIKTGTTKVWTDKEEFGVFMGEAVFYASPDSKAEDDGVVMSSGLHIASGQAFVVILDAKTMTEVARIYHDKHITYGFHSVYVPDAPEELMFV